MSQLLAKITRGDIAELLLRGFIVVAQGQGEISHSVGNAQYLTYMRSAAKPLQTSAALEAGVLDKFDFSDQELAIMCGSHSGEDCHVRVLDSIFNKIGCIEDDLTLGEDLSIDHKLRERRLVEHIAPRRFFNNCSGKHSCMLALCRYFDWDIAAYQLPEHPVQQLILDTVSGYTGVDKRQIHVGVDGCGVPVFGLPLYNMALAYLRLGNSDLLSGARADAARRICAALAAYPLMIAGHGQFCSELIAVTGGRIIAKLGADGVMCLTVRDGHLAAAIKIEDGYMPALAPVTMSLLQQLDLLGSSERAALSAFARMDNINCQKQVVGQLSAAFSL
ncbi:MAG: asparaginase [Bacillota bacterium]|nr:asparaginase [Bacillota bacterium]